MHGFRCLAVLLAAALAMPAARAAAVSPAALDEMPRLPGTSRYQDARAEQTDAFTQTLKLSGDGSFDLVNIAGDVRVETGGANQVRVNATKRVRHRDADEARRYLAQLRIEVTQVGNRVEVRTLHPRTTARSLSASVDYTITVPASTAVNVRSISGAVGVNGVRGEVRAETISGDVDVTATPNLAIAKTVSGTVRARDIGAASSLVLQTISGTVIANTLKVRTLEAGSVSGDVQLVNLQVERLSAKTVSGGIEFQGALARGGRYEFNAHSGGVRLVLAADTPGFELDASTFSGTIRSDFPVTIRSGSGDDNRRGRRDAATRAIRGTFGDSSAILSVRSFSGPVVITRK